MTGGLTCSTWRSKQVSSTYSYLFTVEFGRVIKMIFVIGLFERKSTCYLLIIVSYATVTLNLMGLIIGAWR